MKTYTFRNTEVSLEFLTYQCNGTLAVQLNTAEDGEGFAVVTVNLDSPFQGRNFAFVDENNLPGIGEWLQANGIAIPLGYIERSGFCKYPLYSFMHE